jgi:hypothetical protein
MGPPVVVAVVVSVAVVVLVVLVALILVALMTLITLMVLVLMERVAVLEALATVATVATARASVPAAAAAAAGVVVAILLAEQRVVWPVGGRSVVAAYLAVGDTFGAFPFRRWGHCWHRGRNQRMDPLPAAGIEVDDVDAEGVCCVDLEGRRRRRKTSLARTQSFEGG